MTYNLVFRSNSEKLLIIQGSYYSLAFYFATVTNGIKELRHLYMLVCTRVKAAPLLFRLFYISAKI